jgi:hypothetical protein
VPPLNPYDLDNTSPALPAAAIVADDAPCRRCGYNLRGLPHTGRCPECSASIERSLRGNILDVADPAYLHRLRRGATLVEISILTFVALPLIGFTVAIFSSVLPPIGDQTAALVLGASGLLALVASVLILIGWFMLTERDPGHLGADVSDRSRLVTRIATIICAAAWLLVAGVMTFEAFGSAITALPLAALVGGAMIVLIISLCIQIVASIRYIEHLARRVPDVRLEAELTSTRTLAIVMSACLLSPLLSAIGALFSCLAVIGFFAGLILGLVFAIRYTDAIDRIRRHITAAATGNRVS